MSAVLTLHPCSKAYQRATSLYLFNLKRALRAPIDMQLVEAQAGIFLDAAGS
jgi:hypothetical protein